MNYKQFESRMVELWLTTRIPLTQVHLQHLTGLARKKLDRYLMQLRLEDVLEEDISDEGLMVWSVVGAARSTSGARTVEEYEKLQSLAPAKSTALALVTAAQAHGLVSGSTGRGPRNKSSNRKSILGSGLASLLLGPFGWLYAGSFREAIPACAATVLATSILPGFLLTPLLGILGPVSAIGGVLYAMQYNRSGERRRLLGPEPEKKRLGS